MAEVYLAEQISLGRNVAFKVLKSELATDEKYVRRFNMEARAAAALVHANIVQIYEVGHIEGIHYITQEYVQGQNLGEMLIRNGPPDLPIAIGIMRQVAAALAMAAKRGIVHRDIKPENLMLAGTGEIKVADFGLARVTQSHDQLRLTQVGVTMGSPLYMSPEQAEGKPLDPRSDIYSFGVTCYQMLTGRTPFSGDSALSVAVQHLRSEPDRLENVRSDLPPGLCRIIHRMLCKDPQDRYASGVELLLDLRELHTPGIEGDWPEEFEQFNTAEMVALSQARSAATQQLTAVMSSAEPSAKPFTHRPLFWAGISLAVAFGVALGWPHSEPSLLAGATDLHTGIQPMASGNEQYLFAMQIGSEEAWQSVLEHFPDDEVNCFLARKQLAEIYLKQDRRYEALKIFDDFAGAGETDENYLAYGLAGQYVIMTLDQEHDSAANVLQRLWPVRNVLKGFDPGMLRRVYELILKNDRPADRDKQAEIDKWLAQEAEKG